MYLRFELIVSAVFVVSCTLSILHKVGLASLITNRNNDFLISLPYFMVRWIS